MNPDPRVRFGLKLIEIRKTRGWSQERLALESGLARSYLGGRGAGAAQHRAAQYFQTGRSSGSGAGSVTGGTRRPTGVKRRNIVALRYRIVKMISA